MKIFSAALFLLISFWLAGCSCSGGRNRTDSEYVLDMMSQKSLKAQEGGPQGELLMRLPPEGAKAQNRRYYPYAKNPEKADSLKNPLEMTPKVIQAGKKNYERYCIYCHGRLGDSGEGASVAPKMIVKPPSLLADRAKALSDGQIYHIIYEGRGLMGSYRIQLETAEQLSLSRYIGGKRAAKKSGGGEYRGSENIWTVVSYIRLLQGNRK